VTVRAIGGSLNLAFVVSPRRMILSQRQRVGTRDNYLVRLGTPVDLLLLAKHYFAAMFGAFVLYLLNRLNNRQPFSLFTALQVTLDSRPSMIFSDMIVSSGIGAGVVFLLLNPTSVPEAVTAGLGLTGVLSAFGKDTSK
jgi:hypothetical protein